MWIKIKNLKTLNKKYLKKAALLHTNRHTYTHTLQRITTMNAENYVKAFQGIMGVYGLQFLLVPKKIVRFFDNTFTLCRLFSVILFIPNPIDYSPRDF